MNRIDETRPFIPLRIAVLTVSDTRTQKTDKSGPLLAQFIQDAGHVLADRAKWWRTTRKRSGNR